MAFMYTPGIMVSAKLDITKWYLLALAVMLSTSMVLGQHEDPEYGLQCPEDYITEETTISSPLYPNYTTFWRCGYNIKAPRNKRVLIFFNDFDMMKEAPSSILYTDPTVCNSETEESKDFVQVWKDGERDISTKYYGNELNDTQLLSQGNNMKLLFQAMSVKDRGGFLAQVQFVDKDVALTDDDLEEEIIDESGTHSVSSRHLSTKKRFMIRAPVGKVVQITIDIKTDADLASCQYMEFTLDAVSTMYQEEGSKQWTKCDGEAIGKKVQSATSTALLTVSPLKELPESFTVSITTKFVTPRELCGGDIEEKEGLSISPEVIKAMVGRPLFCIWTLRTTIPVLTLQGTLTVRKTDSPEMCYLGVLYLTSASQIQDRCDAGVSFSLTALNGEGDNTFVVIFSTDVVTPETSLVAKLNDNNLKPTGISAPKIERIKIYALTGKVDKP